MSTITVYSQPSCVQCTATYRALDQNDLDYEIVDLSSDDAAVEIVKALGYLQAPWSSLQTNTGQVSAPTKLPPLPAKEPHNDRRH